MNQNGNGHVPMLGDTSKVRANPQVVGALVLEMDDGGTFEPEKVLASPSGPVAVVGRKSMVSARDLVELMRPMVREEIAAALNTKLDSASKP